MRKLGKLFLCALFVMGAVLLAAQETVSVKDGFVHIEGGTFKMGSDSDYDNEKPVHSVTLSSFYMSDHEVTQAEYEAVMGWNPGSYSGDNLPVNMVSWYEAVAYCNKLSEKEGLIPCYTINGNSYTCDLSADGYRLPTEAEWEYAARGGNKSKGYAYSGSNDIGSVAWYAENSDYKMRDVKTKLPNELGLYDMSGNVWEWCWDSYGDYNSGGQTNPTGASSGAYRVLRGGGWGDDASYCRVASRLNNTPDFAGGDFGFRVVRTDVEYVQVQITAEIFSSVSYAANDGFVFVERGVFNMGSSSGDSDEKPVHSVTVSSFYMSDHEVTQAEYKAVTGNNPSKSVGDNKPVENVSWYDAVAYCNKLSEKEGLTPCYTINDANVSCDFTANGYRLPTEAEWEYAARGGNKSEEYIYSGSNYIGRVAWYSDHQTHDVKTKFPNELGLYDMSGNVREWCWDWYGDYNSGAQTNPTGASWGSYRVLRGGGWRGSDCRVADRSLNTPFYTSSDLGFRVVRTDVESLKQPEKSQSSEAIPDSTVSVLENDYILVEGGSFSMGSTLEFISASDEKPVHKVAVSSFYMSDHEVTQAEYMAVMGSNPSGFSGGSSPVEIVSWYDAIEYCNKLSEMKGLSPCYSLNGTTDTSKWGKKGDPWDNVVCDFTANGYRLPTEAEWEYAARGGNKSNGYIFSGSNGYTTYSGIYDIGSVAWCDEDWGSTHDIKTKQPNELRLYDMSGNVREWCWDWYGSYDSSAQANPTGASSGRSRVYRGGGWLDTLWECRVANRDYSRPGYAFSDLGFRVVRTAK